MNSPISHLTDVLRGVKESAQTFESQLKGNEAATRAALIDPILRALGWDIANPGRVLVEKTQTVQGKSLRVDYALLHEKEIKIVVEAKKLGGDLKEQFLQLVTYSFGLGVESIFVSDGRFWHHYQNLSSNNQNPIQEFNLAVDHLPAMAAYLVQHLDSALICPETPVIDELNQRIVKLEQGLLELRKQPVWNKKHNSKIPTTQEISSGAANASIDTETIIKGENWYSIDGGEKVRSAKAVDTTVNSLRALAQISDQTLNEIEKAMLESFALKKKKVIKRRWIARSREALYDNPKLLSASIEIIPGWWLGTNYSNGDKREMLATAAQVARNFNIQLEFHLV